MQSQHVRLKLRSVAICLLIFTAVKYLFLMPNFPSYTYPSYPHQVIDTNQDKLVQDIIVENDHRTEEILQTFAQRRDHVRNICQTNKIGGKSGKSFKQSLKENNLIKNGKLLEPR